MKGNLFMRKQHKLEVKIMTVRELIEMIKQGKLHYDTTTQLIQSRYN